MAGDRDEWDEILDPRYAGEPIRPESAEFLAASAKLRDWDALPLNDKCEWYLWLNGIAEELTLKQEIAWREAHPKPDGAYFEPGDDEEAPKPQRRLRGKTVRGRYRGGKRDRSADPYYTFMPSNIVSAVEEKRLDTSVIPYASFLYQHIRRSERYKDKGQRITHGELGAKMHRSERSVRRAVAAMVDAGELLVVSSGRSNRNGAIYRFPPRGR